MFVVWKGPIQVLGSLARERTKMEFLVHPIGYVRSSLTDLSQCPNQGREGAPEAWIELDPAYGEGLMGMEPGAEIIILTWMHLADRMTLQVHPQKNLNKPIRGVFGTRSSDRPNPIGCTKSRSLNYSRLPGYW